MSANNADPVDPLVKAVGISMMMIMMLSVTGTWFIILRLTGWVAVDIDIFVNGAIFIGWITVISLATRSK